MVKPPVFSSDGGFHLIKTTFAADRGKGPIPGKAKLCSESGFRNERIKNEEKM
jgi:hypothetical protein